MKRNKKRPTVINGEKVRKRSERNKKKNSQKERLIG